jgi:hypothetical protein
MGIASKIKVFFLAEKMKVFVLGGKKCFIGQEIL